MPQAETAAEVVPEENPVGIVRGTVGLWCTITGVALPEMKRHGYSGRLSTGTLAAGGTLGILIPPSVMLARVQSRKFGEVWK